MLGLINFYRRYIPDCATLISPLTDLTRSRAPNRVEWGDKHEAAFTKVKGVLSKEPILKLPDLDKEFILQTDASDVGIGACLLQQHQGVNTPSSTPVKSYLGENVITRLVGVRRWLLYGQFRKCIGFYTVSISS